MKLKRCPNQHLYPCDEYSACPYCEGGALVRGEKKKKVVLQKQGEEKRYEIESAGPSVYNDRIVTKKELDEMRARASREYTETHKLHVNSRSENIKNGVSGFFDKLYLVWDAIMTTPVGRLIEYLSELGDD